MRTLPRLWWVGVGEGGAGKPIETPAGTWGLDHPTFWSNHSGSMFNIVRVSSLVST